MGKITRDLSGDKSMEEIGVKREKLLEPFKVGSPLGIML